MCTNILITGVLGMVTCALLPKCLTNALVSTLYRLQCYIGDGLLMIFPEHDQHIKGEAHSMCINSWLRVATNNYLKLKLSGRATLL